MARFADLAPPSTCSKEPAKLYKRETTLAGRPFGHYGLPTALFDPSLAGLADALHDLPKAVPTPTPERLNQALRFIKISLNFYETEAAREDQLKDLIKELFPSAKWQDRTSGIRPEAIWDGQIFELKNERGNGGDPKAQTIGSYERLIGDGNNPGTVSTHTLDSFSITLT